MKRIKLYISLILASAFMAACGGGGTITRNDDKDIVIYPDYKNVTIPCNIAPMNFSVKDSTDTKYALQISAGERTMWVDADDKDFNIDADDWKALMAGAKDIQLRGDEPDFSEEGWARRYPKKK